MKCEQCLYNNGHATTCMYHPEKAMLSQYHKKLIAAFAQLPNYEPVGRPYSKEDFIRVLQEVKP